MKSLSLWFVGLMLFACGMGFVPTTHAAMVSDAAVISPSDAAVLKQTLDILDATLDQVDARIAAQVIPAENRANLQVALAGVRGQLSTVRNTLSARTLAVAQQNNPAPAPTPSPAVTQVIPPALSNEGALIPSPQMIAEVPKTEMSPAETASQPVSPETQVAAVSASANSSSRALLWFGVVCLGILGAIFFMRAQSSESPEMEMVKPVAEEPIHAPVAHVAYEAPEETLPEMDSPSPVLASLEKHSNPATPS